MTRFPFFNRTMLGMLIPVSGVLAVPVSSLASDLKLLPSVTVSEEYNDNIFEQPSGAQSDFITRVQPGVEAHYLSSALQGDLNYTLDYKKYARTGANDAVDHGLVLRGRATVVENFLYLDVSDTFTRVSLDIARDNTKESPFLNQTDQNTAAISPQIVKRIGPHGTLKTGYRYVDTRYRNSTAIDKINHEGFADYSHELTDRLTLSAAYLFTHMDSLQGGFDRHDGSGGFRWRYGEKSFLFGDLGNSWLSFSQGSVFSNRFWNAGVNHDFGWLQAVLETRVQYAEDPLTLSTRQTSYSGRVERTLEHGLVGLSASYAEYALAQTGELTQRQFTVGANGRYEVSPKLTATVALGGDRVRVKGATSLTPTTASADYPYHLNGSIGLSYACNYDITVGLSYMHIAYRLALDSSAQATDINRVQLEVKKAF